MQNVRIVVRISGIICSTGFIYKQVKKCKRKQCEKKKCFILKATALALAEDQRKRKTIYLFFLFNCNLAINFAIIIFFILVFFHQLNGINMYNLVR